MNQSGRWGLGMLLSGLAAFGGYGATATAQTTRADCASKIVWSSDFADGFADWMKPKTHWGLENVEFISDSSVRGKVLRVHIGKDTYDPGTMLREKHRPGGTGFKTRLPGGGYTCLHLSYKVRFPNGFDFVRGGKLPGLYGGKGNGGGQIPDGTDGFSTRYMWRQSGYGEVYAYLPTSVKYGTSLGSKSWRFLPGDWHLLEQEIVLNSPERENGEVRVWLDGRLVYSGNSLKFRTVDRLRLDGVFFDLFFGGGDPSWAASEDTYVDFAEFVVRGKV